MGCSHFFYSWGCRPCDGSTGSASTEPPGRALGAGHGVFINITSFQRQGGREGGRRDGGGAGSASGTGRGARGGRCHLAPCAGGRWHRELGGRVELLGCFCRASPLFGMVSGILERVAVLSQPPGAVSAWLDPSWGPGCAVPPVPPTARVRGYLKKANTQTARGDPEPGFFLRGCAPGSLLSRRERAGCGAGPGACPSPPRSPRSPPVSPRYGAD